MQISAEKKALRAHYARLRSAYTPGARDVMHRKLLQAVTSLPMFDDPTAALLCYASLAQETDTWDILRAAWRRGKVVALPRCERHGRMAFYRVDSEQTLQTGMFGIPEPSADCPMYIPAAGDLCIVPGLAFDRQGFRLGYGGGFYDRYLAAYPMYTVGLCYPNCLADRLPTEPFDIPVRQVICRSDEKEA